MDGTLDKAMKVVVRYAEKNDLIDLSKSYIDGMFIRSKNGLDMVGNTKIGKGHKLMAVVDGNGVPIAVHLDSANPHEVTLVEQTLDSRMTNELPDRLIGDRAYDSDKLDADLEEIGVKMIAPHKKNRKNKTQDGRALRAYKKRWKVEDFNNRIQRFRKIVIRYELHTKNFIGFIKIATMMVAVQMIGLQW